MGKQQTRRFREGPLDLEILRTGVLLSAHENRHVAGQPDDIDAALNPLALALTAQGDIVYRDALAALQRLAPGVAGQFLQTQGPAANPQWANVTTHDHYLRMEDCVLPYALNLALVATIARVYLVPYQARVTQTVEAIGWCSGAVAAGNYITGIYEDNGDTPVGGAVIVESPSAAVPGANQLVESTILATQIDPALYWLAVEFDDNTNTARRIDGSVKQGGTLETHFYLRAMGYGALTDPCPATTTQQHNPWQYLLIASVP